MCHWAAFNHSARIRRRHILVHMYSDYEVLHTVICWFQGTALSRATTDSQPTTATSLQRHRTAAQNCRRIVITVRGRNPFSSLIKEKLPSIPDSLLVTLIIRPFHDPLSSSFSLHPIVRHLPLSNVWSTVLQFNLFTYFLSKVRCFIQLPFTR